MVGPHLAYILDEVEEFVGDAPVKVILMKPEYYATLNGKNKLWNHCWKRYSSFQNGGNKMQSLINWLEKQLYAQNE